MSGVIKQQNKIIAKMQATQVEMANKEACQSEEIKRLERELEASESNAQLLEAQTEGMRNIKEIEIFCKTLRLTSEVVEEAIKDFAKKIIDAIDEGRISYSSDLVDFTAEYLEGLKEDEMCNS